MPGKLETCPHSKGLERLLDADPDEAALPLLQVESAKELAASQRKIFAVGRQTDGAEDSRRQSCFRQPTHPVRQTLDEGELPFPQIEGFFLAKDGNAGRVGRVE